MRKEYQAQSSQKFISRLSPLEHSLYAAFSSHQRNPETATFCVFQSAFGTKISFMGVPSDSPLAEHVDWNMEQDNDRNNILLMALDLNRSFESQWPYVPGRYDSLDRFVDHPLIQAKGLDKSRFIDQKSAEGTGLRRSFMKIISSTDEPATPPPETKQKPQLSLIEGYKNPHKPML